MSEVRDAEYDTTKDTVFAPEHRLLETEHFNVVADDYPLTEGHILIIPKENISCVGEFSDDLLREFQKLYDQFSTFVKDAYGSVSTFEHGRLGQTIYHAHVHILPFEGDAEQIIGEGISHLTPVDDFKDLKNAYNKDGRYLFFSTGDYKYLVDTDLGYPRFFRGRFAKALGIEQVGNWQKAKEVPRIKNRFSNMVHGVEHKWQQYQMPSRV